MLWVGLAAAHQVVSMAQERKDALVKHRERKTSAVKGVEKHVVAWQLGVRDLFGRALGCTTEVDLPLTHLCCPCAP